MFVLTQSISLKDPQTRYELWTIHCATRNFLHINFRNPENIDLWAGRCTALRSVVKEATQCCESNSDPDCRPVKDNGNGRTVPGAPQGRRRVFESHVKRFFLQRSGKFGSMSSVEKERRVLKHCSLHVLSKPCAAGNSRHGLFRTLYIYYRI